LAGRKIIAKNPELARRGLYKRFFLGILAMLWNIEDLRILEVTDKFFDNRICGSFGGVG